MNSTGEIIAGAIGGALATATIGFPIAYFALRKYLRFRRDLGQAWRPYFSSVVSLALLHLLGFDPSSETGAGTALFFGVPIVVCATVLYLSFRAPEGSPGS